MQNDKGDFFSPVETAPVRKSPTPLFRHFSTNFSSGKEQSGEFLTKNCKSLKRRGLRRSASSVRKAEEATPRRVLLGKLSRFSRLIGGDLTGNFRSLNRELFRSEQGTFLSEQRAFLRLTRTLDADWAMRFVAPWRRVGCGVQASNTLAALASQPLLLPPPRPSDRLNAYRRQDKFCLRRSTSSAGTGPSLRREATTASTAKPASMTQRRSLGSYTVEALLKADPRWAPKALAG